MFLHLSAILSTWGGGLCSRGVSVQGGGLCPWRGLCAGVLCAGRSLSGGFCPEGSLGVSVQGGLCPGGSLSRGISVQGFSIQGDLCLGWGSLFRGSSVWGFSVQGVDHCPGGLCLGGSLSRTGVSVQGDPPPRTVTCGQYASYWMDPTSCNKVPLLTQRELVWPKPLSFLLFLNTHCHPHNHWYLSIIWQGEECVVFLRILQTQTLHQ